MKARQFEGLAGIAQLLAGGPASAAALIVAVVILLGLGVWSVAGDLTGPSLDLEGWVFDPDATPGLSDPADLDQSEIVADLLALIPPWLLYASAWLQNLVLLVPALGFTALAVAARRRWTDQEESWSDGLRHAFGLRRVSARWLGLGLVGGLAVSWFPSMVLQAVTRLVSIDDTTSEVLAGTIQRSTGPMLAVGVITIAVGVPLLEEVLFRGYLWSLFDRWLPPAAPFVVVTLVFALVHGSPLHVLGVLLIGAWIGWLRWHSGSIWPGVISHVANNALAMALVLATGAEEAGPLGAHVAIGIGSALLMGWLAVLARRWSAIRPDPVSG